MTNAELIEVVENSTMTCIQAGDKPLGNIPLMVISRLKTAERMAEALNDIGLVLSAIGKKTKYQYKCLDQSKQALEEWNNDQ